jgi:hypothetical protein
MSPSRRRAAAVLASLAAIAATFALATSASAFTESPVFHNWVVSGSLTPKKLDQPIALPPGSTFNGVATLNVMAGSKVEGPVTGTLYVPPFKAMLTILGVPEEVGIEFVPMNPVEGSITPGNGPFEVVLSVPTKAIVDITSLGAIGLEVPLSCETAERVTLNLATEENAFSLLAFGSTFTGTTTLPPVRCGGLTGLADGVLLTTLMSGPENPYSITLAPPPSS